MGRTHRLNLKLEFLECFSTAAMRAALSGLLEGQVNIAIEALANIAQNGKSEAARVSAAWGHFG
jgi:hypothetical protein